MAQLHVFSSVPHIHLRRPSPKLSLDYSLMINIVWTPHRVRTGLVWEKICKGSKVNLPCLLFSELHLTLYSKAIIPTSCF